MLHSKNVLFLSFIIVMQIMYSSTIIAQNKPFATKGVVELAGNVSFSSFTPVSHGNTGDATSFFVLAPQIGYFLSDGVEIGLTTGISLLPGLTVISPTGGESTTITQFFFSPAYNVITKNKSLYPFIEANLGYTSESAGNNSDAGFSYGGRAGVKIVAVDNFLVSLAAQYLVITLNPEGATERYGFNYFSVSVGVSGYF
jgi:hypothetical protein